MMRGEVRVRNKNRELLHSRWPEAYRNLLLLIGSCAAKPMLGSVRVG